MLKKWALCICASLDARQCSLSKKKLDTYGPFTAVALSGKRNSKRIFALNDKQTYQDL